MRRNKTITIAEAISDFIKEKGFGEKLSETSLINSWEEITGKAISSRTQRIYVKDHVLYVHLTSSVARNELLMLKEAIKSRLNERAGKTVIRDIVFR